MQDEEEDMPAQPRLSTQPQQRPSTQSRPQQRPSTQARPEHSDSEHDEERPRPSTQSGKGKGKGKHANVAPYIAHLGHTRQIEVKEKVSMIETITAILGHEIEMGNKYKVFGGLGDEMYFATETTDFCTRQMKLCCPDCAPWNMEIIWTAGGHDTHAFNLTRGTTFTCCCFNRPVVEVHDAETRRLIGSIQDPFACCDLTFDVRDPQAKTVLQAKGGCCQWGLCCALPCGPCSQVHFDVENPTGLKVGDMSKKVPSCCTFLLADDVDYYMVEFGKVSNLEHRALLMALAIFVDFRYFSDNSNDNK